MNVIAIIPARGGSTRLKRKNIHPIWGCPMIHWAIIACQKSQHIEKVYVSTEDQEIAALSRTYPGVGIVDRPNELADNFTCKQEVIVHAVKSLEKKPDIVVSLQANSPQISHVDLDSAFEKFIRFNRNEIFSVDENLMMNACFRIMKYDYVFQRTLSTKSGVFVTNYVDIHTLDDLKEVEKRFNPNSEVAG